MLFLRSAIAAESARFASLTALPAAGRCSAGREPNDFSRAVISPLRPQQRNAQRFQLIERFRGLDFRQRRAHPLA